MLWHPRCRWPARLSLSPTPQHGPRKNATSMFPTLDVLMGNAQARRRIRLGCVTFTGAVTKMRHPYRRFYLCSCYGNAWVLSALPGEFNESTQHLLILADEEVCEWRGMHGHGSRRNRRLSCGSAGRAVNVWRTSRERLRGGTRAASIGSWLAMEGLLQRHRFGSAAA